VARLMIVSDETAERLKADDRSAVEVPIREEFDRLVQSLMPPTPRVAEAGLTEQARRNAELRQHVMESFEFLDATAVARLSGSKSANPRARASRWANEGRIFGITVNGRALYPSFQFEDHGQPREAVADILTRLRQLNLSAWAIAIWWNTGHDALDWRKPATVLIEDPSAVLAAADIDLRTLGR
jgi:hypothetical protein